MFDQIYKYMLKKNTYVSHRACLYILLCQVYYLFYLIDISTLLCLQWLDINEKAK